jgi:hypothetical protein
MDQYPNLTARVAESERRTKFASVRAFGEDFTEYGRTEAELRLAFAAVMDAENWKYPIGAAFDALTRDEALLVGDAVGFYAGCMAETWTDPENGHAEVWASGYYEAVGS